MTAEQDGAKKALISGFIYRVIAILGLLGLAMLTVLLADVLLLLFGAVLAAVVLRAIADPLANRTPLDQRAALALTIILLFALVAISIWLFGREVSRQLDQLFETIPGALNSLMQRMETNPLGRQLAQQIQRAGEEANVLSLAPGIAMDVLTGLTALVVVLITGMILAGKPANYRDGMVILFPPRARNGVREAFDASGRALRLWLLSQFFSMTVIGLLVGIGLSIVGVPSAPALGLLAGIAQFVPLAGPIASAIPGLIIAASVDTETFIWALVVYVIVQQFEGNFLTPLVMRRAAHIPIPITLFAVLAFAVLFGVPGVILATPLAVVIYVMVKKLYLRDMLGDEVLLPHEKPPQHGQARAKRRKSSRR